jgi:hypothetical protein
LVDFDASRLAAGLCGDQSRSAIPITGSNVRRHTRTIKAKIAHAPFSAAVPEHMRVDLEPNLGFVSGAGEQLSLPKSGILQVEL